MRLTAIVFSVTLALGLLQSRSAAAETPVIDPAKAAQLQRLKPLTPEKIDVFVESGQLTQAQAEYVKRHLGPKGQLALPEAAVGPERPKPPAARAGTPSASAPAAPAAPAAPVRRVQSSASSDPYASFFYKFADKDQDRLTALIQQFRHGDHAHIGRQLRAARPEVNQLIARAYTDPVDLPLKVALWEEVAGPVDPDAAIGLFDTHRAACELARPVLIAYDKDAGGVHVRRSPRSTDFNAFPPDRFFTSRELRELILDIEGLIARCAGPSAAIFLMDVYAQRYGEGEAPMRDKGRDRSRLVQACGGNPKKFDEDESGTWSSTLPPSARAAIAGHLIPWLSHGNSDRRKIARNGLLICLPRKHPAWEASRGEWERWWDANKNELMSAR